MHDARLFVKNVRFFINEKGMKIGEVEKSAGLRPGFLSRWEGKKESSPKLDTACRIADVLGVSLSDLVTEDCVARKRMEQLRKELWNKRAEMSQIEWELGRLHTRELARNLTIEDYVEFLKAPSKPLEEKA